MNHDICKVHGNPYGILLTDNVYGLLVGFLPCKFLNSFVLVIAQYDTL